MNWVLAAAHREGCADAVGGVKRTKVRRGNKSETSIRGEKATDAVARPPGLYTYYSQRAGPGVAKLSAAMA